MRIVTNKLRTARLTTDKQWALNGNQKVVSPPPYNEDAVWVRKARIAFTTVVGGVSVTFAEIMTALGLPTTVFTRYMVTHMALYGGSTIPGVRLTPYISSANTTTPDREFSDFGTVGAARPCIKVSISTKDNGYCSIPTAIAASLFTLDEAGAPVVGTVVVDFVIHLKNTAVVTRERRELLTSVTERGLLANNPITEEEQLLMWTRFAHCEFGH
jgi:hypothetical protein